MGFDEEFTRKIRETLGIDNDEKILKESFSKIILYFNELEKQIGEVEDETFVIRWLSIHCVLKMRNRELWFIPDYKQNKNEVKVSQVIDGEESIVDVFYVKEGKLYSREKNKEFNIDIVREHLRETFGEIVGL